MTIKAILRDGRIQPLEPLPPDWTEGQELVVEEPESVEAEARINQWTKELDQATAQIPTEEHDRFLHALDEIERASKDAVRRECSVKATVFS
ncbi:MAG: hypothetical protein JWP03_1327 [Phycisphaerales bacterium]|nr:hypothetical protein [Phycisphaerales bacterium]